MAGMIPPFEQPIAELAQEIEALEVYKNDPKVQKKIERLQRKLRTYRKQVYDKLNPWQIVQVSRHPERPHTLDYIRLVFDDFLELHGDRRYGDDPAILAGIAKLDKQPVAVIGHQKGRSMDERMERNFGMPHPEGYRKALRVMKLAAKFGRPIIIFVDTPGAYPGLGAEKRGQAEAIAENLKTMVTFPVPILVLIIGEGGSGGALAVAVGDRILMLQFAVYSVISPEGCASILWRDASRAPEAAQALKLTAKDLLELGAIDAIIEEPLGGAHTDPKATAETLKTTIQSNLRELLDLPPERLLEERYNKFRALGRFEEW